MDLSAHIPHIQVDMGALKTEIPRIAKCPHSMLRISEAVERLHTGHRLILGDAREVAETVFPSVHLVVTSPPYWTLKKYNTGPGQLGDVAHYGDFLACLNDVWEGVRDILVPGGRLVVVVGDVCLSRKQNGGRHCVVPLHAAIQEQCRALGYDNLSPIIWSKIANASHEGKGPGAFLGKPYEPNAVIKNDIEYLLMEKVPGYRSPSASQRLLSVIGAEDHSRWFQQIWTGLPGASTKAHPAPYPVELAKRLIRMFSFVGDTVLDPFSGTGTTSIAARDCGRNSVGVEIDPDYLSMAKARMRIR